MKIELNTKSTHARRCSLTAGDVFSHEELGEKFIVITNIYGGSDYYCLDSILSVRVTGGDCMVYFHGKVEISDWN